jgi:replicative DNA helicase
LKSLDKLLGGGVEYGNVVLYGGRQKVGKSMLLSHTAKSFGLAGIPYGYFSLEMTNNAVMTRLLCDMSGVEKDRIRRIEWTDSEWERIEEQAATVEDFPAWYAYGISTVKGISQALAQVKRQDGVAIKVIFVDYVQLMSHPGKKIRREELSAISRSFKRMSVELGEPMIIFLAAQVNRESAKNAVISANTFYGTGDLERDMDIGVILHTVKDDDGEERTDVRQITVVGSRETDVGTITVDFNGSTASIRDQGDPGNEITIDHWRQQTQRLQTTEELEGVRRPYGRPMS